MRYFKIILFVVGSFLIESFLQILFESINVFHFENETSFKLVLKDTFYILFTLKLIFYLPIYLIFYLLSYRAISSLVRLIAFHSILFLIGTIVLGFFFPPYIANSILVIIGFLIVSIFTAAGMYKIFPSVFGDVMRVV